MSRLLKRSSFNFHKIRNVCEFLIKGRRLQNAKSNRTFTSSSFLRSNHEVSTTDQELTKKSQKTDTVTDSFGRVHTYLRISLTERCNFRCTYCMPAEGVTLQPKSDLLTNEEIFYLTKLFAESGVEKIRLTGGEPTIRRDILDIVENIKGIPGIKNLGITTNGLRLTKVLVDLQRCGLDSLNISLDTLKPHKFEQITRRKGFERVVAGIDLAMQLGYRPKINVVLMRDYNNDEILDFVQFTADRNVDIRFIEYMPFMGNRWNTDRLVSFKESLNMIKGKWPNLEALKNQPNDTSKAYKVPGFLGQIGFITSMTEHFCGTCNRLRLTADGNLKVCLFGNSEVSLRDALRTNYSKEDLQTLIKMAVMKKKSHHADKALGSKQKKHTEQHAINIIPTVNRKPQILEIYKNQPNLYSNIPAVFSIPVKYNAFRIQKNYLHTSFNGRSSKMLTHLDKKGEANMVDVSNKIKTLREAEAAATVILNPEIVQIISNNQSSKGNVLSIAQLAGIMGAKKTSELIPLCHNIKLTSIKLNLSLDKEKCAIEIKSQVRCYEETGVEMEALTAVAVAALTVYDMCKAVSHEIRICEIRLLKKTGGKDDYQG